MWDKDALNQLLIWLDKEKWQLRKKGAYKDLDPLKNAANEIEKWLETQIPQEVEARLLALVGAERLDRFGTERFAESTLSAPPRASARVEPESGSAAQNVESPVSVEPAPVSPAAVSAQEEAHQVRGAAESESGEDPLLARLREIKKRSGEISLEKLENYLKELEEAAQTWKNQRKGVSIEANEALSIVQDGRDLLGWVAQKAQKESAFDKAEGRKDLWALRDVLQEIATIRGKVQGAVNLFKTAASAAEEEFNSIYIAFETRRTEISASLNTYLTYDITQLEKRLDTLEQLVEEHVPYVPSALDEKDVTLLTTGSVFRQTKLKFIEVSQKKATELKIGIRAAIDASDDRLDSAAKDCDAALSWLVSKHIQKELAGNPLVETFRELSSEIEGLKRKREATQSWLSSTASMDRIEVLTQWDEHIFYPKLEPEITNKRSWIIRNLISDLRADFEHAKSESLNAQSARSYEKARDKFSDVSQKITRLVVKRREMVTDKGAPDAQLLARRTQIEQEFSAGIQSLEADLKSELLAIQAQQKLWTNFEQKRHDARAKLNAGAVNAQVKQEIESEFTPEERATFVEEWLALQKEVERQGNQAQIIRDAEELFGKDPTNVQIESTLTHPENKDLLVTDPSLRLRAESLLKRHYAYSSRADCLQVFDGIDLDQDTPEGWLKRVYPKIENLKQRAQAAQLNELGTSATEIEKASRRVNVAWGKIRPMLKAGHFVEASQFLDQFDATVGDAHAQGYEQRGLNSLRRKLNHAWRANRWEKIVSLSLRRNGLSRPDIGEVDQVKGYAEELRDANLLIEDGDMPIYKEIEDLWHERHIEKIFGKSLDQVNPSDLDRLAKRQNVDWQDLLAHIEPLSTRSVDIATLRVIACAHWAAELPPEKGVQELEAPLKDVGRYKERFVVYPAMVMMLVQMGKYDRAREIGQQLKDLGRQFQKLTLAIEKILEAAGAYEKKQLIPALAAFDVAIENLQNDYAEFSTGWDLLKDATTRQWRGVLGNACLEEVKNFNPLRAPINELFSKLDKLLIASEYLNDPPVIRAQAERLSDRINENISTLEGNIDAYLVKPGPMLERALKLGQLYYSQLKSLRKVSADPDVSAYIHIPSDLEQKLRNLGDWVRDSERDGNRNSPLPLGTLNKAWKVIQRLRAIIKNEFLPGKWFWNRIVEESPLQDLKDYRQQCELERRETGIYDLRFNEIDHLWGWLSVFEKATSEITNKLKIVTENFPDKFEDSLSALDELALSLKRNEQELTRYPNALGELLEPVDMERHIRVISTLSSYEFKNGKWFRTGGAARELNRITEVRDLVNLVKKNFEQWERFTSSVIELLDGDLDRQYDGIYLRLNKARLDLRNGKVGKSFNALCNDIPVFVEHFKTKKRELKNMEPPLTTAAIHQALRFPDFDLLGNLSGDPEKFSAGKVKISTAKPEEMGSAWDEYLDLHIQFQEEILMGSAIKAHFDNEGVSLVEGAKDIYRKVPMRLRGFYRGKEQDSIKNGIHILGKELETDEDTLDKLAINVQKQPTSTSFPLILDCCVRKMILEVQKETLKVQLNAWKGKITSANQRIYLDLIEKAERIDKEDETIKKHRLVWEEQGQNIGDSK